MLSLKHYCIKSSGTWKINRVNGNYPADDFRYKIPQHNSITIKYLKNPHFCVMFGNPHKVFIKTFSEILELPLARKIFQR